MLKAVAENLKTFENYF